MSSSLKMPFFVYLVVVFLFYSNGLCYELPNFILILTDDQDLSLGGLYPMKNAQELLANHGAKFKNMFVTTPLCCPSRSSILTGKYAHTIDVRNNSVSGNCNSLTWQKTHERRAFITKFKNSNYSTFYAGKYLNQYGKNTVGGIKHIPPGWDQWIGLVGNSRYYNYSLSINGVRVNHGSDPNKDYLTNIVFKEGYSFIRKQNRTTPFFMFLSPPAPHDPFTPFPPYRNKFPNFKAPRTPNFAIPGGKHKHWLLQQPPNPLSNFTIDKIDEVFQNRWRTLLSVDNHIRLLIDLLNDQNILDNTYIFLTSDNGFHLGQFSLPWDKRQPYEFDIRVPLLVRGPGIKSGITIEHPVLNIDLAPTFLELANLTTVDDMDGKSFASLLKNRQGSLNKGRSFIVEHQGEYSEKPIEGCPQYPPKEVNICEIDCICEDSWNNTYTCLRELSKEKNLITCIFKDNENFGETYNITEDPFQMKNIFTNNENQYAINILNKLKS